MRIKAKARKTFANRKRVLSARSPQVWLAMGTLAMYSAGRPRTAMAASSPARNAHASVSAEQTQDLPVRRFDIPPGPLEDVARGFNQATGIEMRFADPKLKMIRSPGVSGLYSDVQALTEVLKGTGIDYRFVGPMRVVLDTPAVKTTVAVHAEVSPLTSVAKYTERLLDTPQSISVVQQRTIQDQGLTTLRDTLRNFAGISIAAGEGGAQGDNLTIRGFSARNDIFLDGMRDFGSYYRDPFNLEEVAVLRGPSSVTFGRGSTGGIINQETKTPGLTPFISGGLQFGTDKTRRATVDINRSIPGLGQTSAFRLNIMGDQGNVAGRDIAENRRFGIAPSLAFGLGTPTRLTLSYFHQNEDDIPDYGIPWLFNGPAPVNRRNYYGFGDTNFLRTYADVGTAKVEHDFNSAVSLRNQLRYANYARAVQITEARAVAGVDLETPLDAIDVSRNQIALRSNETSLDNQLDLTVRAKSGPFVHTLVFGGEAARETSSPVRFSYAGVPGTSLLNPDENEPFRGTAEVSSRVNTRANSLAAYALDTMKLGRHWEFTGGFRFDRFSANYNQNIAPALAFHRVDHMPSWRAAIVYKPVGRASIYVSSGTSFNPSAESLSLSAGNANLPPEKNMTYEAGGKWEAVASRLTLRTAVFRTDKTNAREPDPNNPALNVLAGRQRVDGVEWEANGRITDRWEMLAGYAWLNARVTSSVYYPGAIGARLANVPRNSFNFWSTYHFPWRHIDGGAGGQFVDARTSSSTAPLDPVTGLVKEAPGYWVFNAMARYPIGEHLDLQANVYNLANRYYYDQLHPGHIVPGVGRSALIGLNFKF